MDTSEPPSVAAEEFLDLFLRGQVTDAEAFISARPDLGDRDRHRIRGVARALGSGRGPDVDSIPTAGESASVPGQAGLLGEMIGDHRLIRRLGAGGMGTVFLAEDTVLHRLVALKVPRAELAGSDEAGLRFSREAQALARLSHPHVVTVYGAGESGSLRYLVMEYIEGPGVDEILEGHRQDRLIPDVRTVACWGRDIARALEAVHGAGLQHRDVKPSNIRITSGGSAILVDFGLAFDESSGSLTLTGAFRGSPHYASPEQVAARRLPIDHRTDIYSLGVTLYEALTGEVPFQGESAEQIFRQIATKEPKRPRAKNPSVPRDLETVVLKAMEKEPEQRYPDARGLAEDLDALLAMRPIRARPAGPFTRGLKAVRRHPGATVAGVLAVFIVASIFVFRAVQDRIAFRRHLEDAEAASLNGEHARALAALERALGFRPDDEGAIRKREAVIRAERRATAATLLKEARDHDAAWRTATGIIEGMRGRLAPIHGAMGERALNLDETGLLVELEEALARSRVEAASALMGAGDALKQALDADPEFGEAREELVRFHLARWRESWRKGDSVGAARHRELARIHDHEGRHVAEIAGRGRLNVVTDPPGAAVHAFRYVDRSVITGKAEPRLVPVPVDTPVLPAFPGTWALRVVRAAGSLKVNDLILRVEDRPVEGSLFVAVASAECGIRPGDRVEAYDGYRCQVPADLEVPVETGVSPLRRRPARLQIERKGASLEFDVTAADVASLVITDAAGFVNRIPARATIVSDGVIREMEVPAGVEVRTTAAPLFLGPGSLRGSAPLRIDDLEQGSYLLLVRLEGYEDLRHPVMIEAGSEASVSVRLHREGTTPPGFVWVPGGSVVLGQEGGLNSPLPRRTYDVPGFWIQEREVTWGEYLIFLNDPETRAAIDASESAVLFPRDTSNADRGGYLVRKGDGTFSFPPGDPSFSPAHPILAISSRDALAYAAWLRLRTEAAGGQGDYDLPSEVEWEKAGRGADERPYTYGTRFLPHWMKTRFSRPRYVAPEPVLRHQIDESPYGVFDLGGSVGEFCNDSFADGRSVRLRGGSWIRHEPEIFALTSRFVGGATTPFTGIGIRLVIRPRS